MFLDPNGVADPSGTIMPKIARLSIMLKRVMWYFQKFNVLVFGLEVLAIEIRTLKEHIFNQDCSLH